MIDWDKPATEAQIAQFIEDDRLPEPEELKALLERYLIGPITDEHATRLHADMDAILKDRPRLAGDTSTFRDRHHYAAGHAWCEEFSYGRGIPRTADLAIFHAATMRGYPAPKLYCPAFFVGTWKQGDPSPATAEPVLWRLAANGDFQSNHRSFAKNTQWCIQRSDKHPDTFLHSGLRVREPCGGWRPLHVQRISDHGLSLGELCFDGNHTYELERCPDELGSNPRIMTRSAPAEECGPKR